MSGCCSVVRLHAFVVAIAPLADLEEHVKQCAQGVLQRFTASLRPWGDLAVVRVSLQTIQHATLCTAGDCAHLAEVTCT